MKNVVTPHFHSFRAYQEKSQHCINEKKNIIVLDVWNEWGEP